QISATRNNQCFCIHANYPSSQVGIYTAASNSWFRWNGPWGGLMQISTGVDRYGNDQVYMLNGSQQVFRLDHGMYSVLPFKATQISAGAGRNWTDNDVFYIDTSSWHEVFHYDGNSSKYLGWGASQISAGLDSYGNEI